MAVCSSPDFCPSFSVLIPAAGGGTRMGGSLPKQYRPLAGKTVLRRTIERFLACSGCLRVQIVIDPAHETLYRASIAGLDLPSPVAGGTERQDSVLAGIDSLAGFLKGDDILLIHDAARPFVTVEDIHAVARAAMLAGAATLAAPVTDTLVHRDGTYPDRAALQAIQTPQGFRYGLLRAAHRQARDAGRVYTDDTALVAALGHTVTYCPGGRHNIKLTTPEDWTMAARLLTETVSFETRTGTGYDVHAFAESPAKNATIRLCGVELTHTQGLAGHSDADVGLHALTDALLGTVGAGDIGQHFPPGDPQWRGADSARFVEKAVDIIGEKGGKIVNIDLTLICETPKIGPHRDALRARVAQICGIAETRVNVKATTTEGLGFTGRKEGIAALAVATVRIETRDEKYSNFT